MTHEDHIVQAARAKAMEVLAPSRVYLTLPLDDQRSVYLAMVDEEIRKQEEKSGLYRPLATDSGKEMGYKGYDPGFSGDTKAFTELVESVDFPQFVADLLKAVFDANLKVMKQQTDSYIKLMKEATKSTADFIKKVGDEESFARLAESRGDQYNVITEKNPDGSTKLALTNPEGEKADVDDAQVKMHILEAKINMAKEHRAALREVLLMGVTRLVVNKGLIEAGVEFSVKATRASGASHQDQNINVANVETGFGGGLGGLFGGPSGSISVQNTNIQVNTSDKKATDDLSATLKGLVKIEFKTDYFKLDNFAQMYADGGVKAIAPGQTPAGAPTPPAK
ncbi:hypothetical protein AB0M36_17155 [Actinoplanes sp. NPDC051346]|uniref:hypothetical protein n=1 Tax=Actinoplanes sp. NPDC051346 TaxID=3155048 RepID=UPI003420E147